MAPHREEPVAVLCGRGMVASLSPVAPRASERILNLAMYLLSAPGPRLHSDIRENLEAYQQMSDGAYLRAFERDKRLLRELGVPLRTVEVPETDAGVGYVIDAGDFELPPVEFDAEEAMLIELAARMWRAESVGAEAVGGLMKLQAAGARPVDRPDAFVPRLTPPEPGFDIVWDALLKSRRLGFTYRGTDRVVQPWRLVTRQGSSYLIGFDETREAPRVFKLARITQGPEPVGETGEVPAPDPADVDAAVARLMDPDPARRRAIVAVRRDRQGMLTRGGERLDATAPDGFDLWRVPFGSTQRFAADLAAAADDVIAVDPPELRDAVIDHLQGVLR